MMNDWHIDYAPKENSNTPRLCLQNHNSVKVHFCKHPVFYSAFIFEKEDTTILFSPTNYQLDHHSFEESKIIKEIVTEESWNSGLPSQGYLKIGEISVGNWSPRTARDQNFNFLGHVHFPTVKSCCLKIELAPEITKKSYENCFQKSLQLGCNHILIPWNPIDKEFINCEKIREWRAATAIGVLEAAATVFANVPANKQPYIEICSPERIPIWDDKLCFSKDARTIFQKFIQESEKWDETDIQNQELPSHIQGLQKTSGKIFTLKKSKKLHCLIFVSSLEECSKKLSHTLFFIEKHCPASHNLCASIFNNPLFKELNFIEVPNNRFCLYAILGIGENIELKPGTPLSLLSLINLYLTCLKEAHLRGFQTIVVPFLRFKAKTHQPFSEAMILKWEATVKTSLLIASNYWFQNHSQKRQINIIVRINN